MPYEISPKVIGKFRPSARILCKNFRRDFSHIRSGHKPKDPRFPIVDARKTLAWINTRAGTTVQGHGLRATFASIAEELVSGGERGSPGIGK